jgi:hypothetical protein
VELSEDPASQPLLIFPSSHDHRELFMDESLALFRPILRHEGGTRGTTLLIIGLLPPELAAETVVRPRCCLARDEEIGPSQDSFREGPGAPSMGAVRARRLPWSSSYGHARSGACASLTRRLSPCDAPGLPSSYYMTVTPHARYRRCIFLHFASGAHSGQSAEVVRRKPEAQRADRG